MTRLYAEQILDSTDAERALRTRKARLKSAWKGKHLRLFHEGGEGRESQGDWKLFLSSCQVSGCSKELALHHDDGFVRRFDVVKVRKLLTT